MNLTLRDAIIAAISYADIFDYPLTEEELRVWLPFISKRTLLAKLQGESLRSCKRFIAIRKQREEWSREKWIRARRVGKLLKLVPTITLVGVTGGLTRSNARQEDDIDFLIITAPNTLWVSRALSTVLLDFFRLRRRPGDTHFRNLICLNMFMSEDGLSVPASERDLFTAHEVLLMTPLWERDGAYTKFLQANRWAKKFLPNAWHEKAQSLKLKSQSYCVKRKAFIVLQLFAVVLRFTLYTLRVLEPFARNVQLSYMKKRRSTEVVGDALIRFHPHDARVWIKMALGRRLARFKIPLDKIFYGR